MMIDVFFLYCGGISHCWGNAKGSYRAIKALWIVKEQTQQTWTEHLTKKKKNLTWSSIDREQDSYIESEPWITPNPSPHTQNSLQHYFHNFMPAYELLYPERIALFDHNTQTRAVSAWK